MESCNERFQMSDDTGWNYITTPVELLFRDLAQFYKPKCFDDQNKYVKTSEIKEFVCNNYPAFVFDALELFASHIMDKEFEIKANTLLKHNG